MDDTELKSYLERQGAHKNYGKSETESKDVEGANLIWAALNLIQLLAHPNLGEGDYREADLYRNPRDFYHKVIKPRNITIR